MIFLYQFAIKDEIADKLFKFVYLNINLLTEENIELLIKVKGKYNSENLKYLQKIESAQEVI